VERWLLVGLAAAGAPAVCAAYVVTAEAGLRRIPPRWRQAARPWLWLLPAAVLLGVFLVYPTLGTLVYSFRDASGERWVGLQNYLQLLSDREVQVAVRNNLIWLAGLAGVVVLLGFVLAVLLERVPYAPVAKAILFLPMALSFTAAAVIWRFVYEYRPAGTAQVGLLNALLTHTLPGFQPRAWLVHAPGNTLLLVAAGVWVWTGFATVVFSAALKTVPQEVVETARVDGAGELRVLWNVVAPLLAPVAAVVATTMVITSLKVFDLVYVMTNGNYGTEVLANRMYKELFNVRHLGRASALAVVLLLCTLPAMAANLRRFLGEAGR